jgi:hypothetical protein
VCPGLRGRTPTLRHDILDYIESQSDAELNNEFRLVVKNGKDNLLQTEARAPLKPESLFRALESLQNQYLASSFVNAVSPSVRFITKWIRLWSGVLPALHHRILLGAAVHVRRSLASMSPGALQT